MKLEVTSVLASAIAALLLAHAPFKAIGAEKTPLFRGYSYVDLGNPAALQLGANSPFTYEVWMKAEFVMDTMMVFNRNNARTTPHSYRLGFTAHGSRMAAHTGAGGSPANATRYITLPEPIKRGRWYHLAYSYDGTNIKFIVNGEYLGMAAYSYADDPAHTVKIGGGVDLNDVWGWLSEARLWNYARDAAEIAGDMGRRLSGTEKGLIGYWPLDEGEDDEIHDRTANASHGTMVVPNWSNAYGLELSACALAHPVTGSRRYTNTNEVRLAGLSIPYGRDSYQVTFSDNPASLNPAAWRSTDSPQGTVSFPQPAGDGLLTAHFWFTNSVGEVALYHDTASIYYTTVAPTPTARASLSREASPLSGTVIQGSDLDDGSGGGEVDGEELAIYSYRAVSTQPGDYLSPDEAYATLPGAGSYSLRLTVVNEAGNSAASASVTAVDISSYGGLNLWTGLGLTDNWSDGGNWSAGLPVAGQDVAIRSATANVLLDGAVEVGSLEMTAGTLIFTDWESCLKADDVVISGGTVTTIGEFADFDPSNRVWIVALNDFTLSSPGKIDVSGKGYYPMAGKNLGTIRGYGCGGGHGGQGGTAYNLGCGVYDSLTAPLLPGTGGFSSVADSRGGNGGGAVRIEAGNNAIINGVIAANGANGAQQSGGGGAGGSIYITAAYFGGNANGQLQVNGGNEVWVRYGGGGGGGRIAVDGGEIVDGTAVRFSSTVGKSMHDLGDSKTFTDRGCPQYLDPFQAWIPHWGTLYIEDGSFLANADLDSQFVDIVAHFGGVDQLSLPSLTLSNGRFRLAPEGFKLEIAGDLTVKGNAHLSIEGSLDVDGDLLLSGQGRLSVYAGATNGVDQAYGALVEVARDVVISDTAWLQPHSHPTNGAVVMMRMRDLIITGEESGVNASGRGFAHTQGPGAGTGTARGGGGAYGGAGAMGLWSAGGSPYGNPYFPVLPGSGGGRGSNPPDPAAAVAGYGGGAILIDARGDVTLDGQIVTRGSPGKTHYIYSGAGAGGGIWITCKRLVGGGTGLLSVVGGRNGGEGSGGGGGGRIAVWQGRMPAALRDKLMAGDLGSAFASTNAPPRYFGDIDVSGGDGGTNPVRWGDPGTVWFIQAPPQETIFMLR